MIDRIKMTVEMNVTIPQGLALQAMFEYWNQLSGAGSSREVGFYCDGDGNFHPKCKVSFDKEVPELTTELKEKAVTQDRCGNRLYDYDSIGWHFINQQ